MVLTDNEKNIKSACDRFFLLMIYTLILLLQRYVHMAVFNFISQILWQAAPRDEIEAYILHIYSFVCPKITDIKG